jgi:transcriptional regulator with XRE-family HTH domain
VGSIVERIDEARKKKGLTSQALLQQIGLGRSALSDWRSGQSRPRAAALLALARQLAAKK